MKFVPILLLIVAMLVVGPLAAIWAMNTLFPVLNIGYGFAEWAAVIILGATLRANVTVNK